MKVALCQINPVVGALRENRRKIESAIEKAKGSGAELVVFPEMALLGYPPEDLLLIPNFIEAVEKELAALEKASHGIALAVGTIRRNPLRKEKPLFNTVAIFEDGQLRGFQDKQLLPEYDVFAERRYFEPGRGCPIWSLRGEEVAFTVCEDIWQHGSGASEYSDYPVDPVAHYIGQRVDFMVNLSASPFYTGRHHFREKLAAKVAQSLGAPLLLCNQVGANDSLLFDGHSLAVTREGELAALARGFEEDLLFVDTRKMQKRAKVQFDGTEELFKALKMGIEDYFSKLGFKKACIGLSGGIDSAVVLYLAHAALGANNLLTLGMPSRFSSPESLSDARLLAKRLGVEFKEISIEEPFESFLRLLKPDFKELPFDTTEENLQARIRGMILMAYSNKFGHLVLSTGNKSEFALGYTTLYGDMCGGLAVLGDVSKGEVYKLAHWINRNEEIIPREIIEKPPSAELRKDQKDSDTLPPYPILDLVIREYVEERKSPEEIARIHSLDPALISDLIRRIHASEYKRRQGPPVLRVTKKSFTMGRRFPIVQTWA